MGTPTHCYDETGKPVWERELDIYGAVRKEIGEKGFVPQLYQGQYVDEETGLAYNRFRYYDSDAGNYISQDPIGLAGGMVLYGYVHDNNAWIDLIGLSRNSELYYLVAQKDGLYNVYEFGHKNPVGKVFLKKGDIWKIGESYNPKRRYSQAYLTREGVELKRGKGLGSKVNIRKLETGKIKKFQKRRGRLPAGNKTHH